MKKLMIVIAFLGTGACAMKQKIMDAGAVSMTHNALAANESLKETGPVTGQFCPDSFKDKGSIGLIDEAIKNAQETNKVDYIVNASVFHQGNCTLVEGTGAKVVSKSEESKNR